jgi:prolipoprotein diacylglyceryl transferase
LGVLVGSRLGHVLFYDLDKALDDPMWVFEIWTGGLASHGAVVELILAMWLFTKRRGVPFLEGADRFSYSAALGATLVRLGNFFNSEIVGRKVLDQSWGVRFPRYDQAVDVPLRYPTQIFEVLLGLFVMLCLYITDKKMGEEKRPRGLMISVFFLVYFAGRFVVEFFKEYQTLDQSSALTMGQYLSIPGFFIGLVGVVATLKNRVPSGWPEEEGDEDDEDETDEDEDDTPSDPNYDPDVDEALAGDQASEDEEKSTKEEQGDDGSVDDEETAEKSDEKAGDDSKKDAEAKGDDETGDDETSDKDDDEKTS